MDPQPSKGERRKRQFPKKGGGVQRTIPGRCEKTDISNKTKLSIKSETAETTVKRMTSYTI